MPAVRKVKKSARSDASPYEPATASSPDTTSEQELECGTKRAGQRKRMERKGPWLPAEDAVLVALVSRLGAHSWSKIATHIPGRVGKQCRERYYNHLAPEVNKEPWTPAEELRVMKLHAEHGNSWALISRLLNTGRTANDVKNLWNCALKKRLMESGEEEVMAETQAEIDSGCCSCKRRGRGERHASKSSSSSSSTSMAPEMGSVVSDADEECDDCEGDYSEELVMPTGVDMAAPLAAPSELPPMALSDLLLVKPEPKHEPAQSPLQAQQAVVVDQQHCAVDATYHSDAAQAVVSPPSSTSPSPLSSPFELEYPSFATFVQQAQQQQQQAPAMQLQMQQMPIAMPQLQVQQPFFYSEGYLLEPPQQQQESLLPWWNQEFVDSECSC
eukprot:m51a1_g4842 putative myb-related protein 3r-1-like (386) ;mRNA; r:224682-226465